MTKWQCWDLGSKPGLRDTFFFPFIFLPSSLFLLLKLVIPFLLGNVAILVNRREPSRRDGVGVRTYSGPGGP